MHRLIWLCGKKIFIFNCNKYIKLLTLNVHIYIYIYNIREYTLNDNDIERQPFNILLPIDVVEEFVEILEEWPFAD